MNSRVVSAVTVVVLVHAALIALLVTIRNEPPARALESRAITAELLSPAPAAAPVAVQSPAPQPAPRVKPQAELKPVPAPKVKSEPLPQDATPSLNAPAPSELAPPAPAASPAPPATQAAAAAPAGPAVDRETLAIAAPKEVAHLDCSIAKPAYPSLSRRRGEAGTASVHFVVGLTGKIEGIELKKSSGFSRLDEAAMAAMRASACRPYVENGTPVLATYTQPFTFGFDD
jgi:protein TonB